MSNETQALISLNNDIHDLIEARTLLGFDCDNLVDYYRDLVTQTREAVVADLVKAA